jgi:hypothetical protein
MHYYLNKVLSDFGSVEHRIKRRDLVDPHGRHFHDRSHLIHSSYRDPTAALSLGKVQQWNAACLLVVGGVTGQDGVYLQRNDR